MNEETAERIATALEKIADKLDNLYWDDYPLDSIVKKIEKLENVLDNIDSTLISK